MARAAQHPACATACCDGLATAAQRPARRQRRGRARDAIQFDWQFHRLDLGILAAIIFDIVIHIIIIVVSSSSSSSTNSSGDNGGGHDNGDNTTNAGGNNDISHNNNNT